MHCAGGIHGCKRLPTMPVQAAEWVSLSSGGVVDGTNSSRLNKPGVMEKAGTRNVAMRIRFALRYLLRA